MVRASAMILSASFLASSTSSSALRVAISSSRAAALEACGTVSTRIVSTGLAATTGTGAGSGVGSGSGSGSGVFSTTGWGAAGAGAPDCAAASFDLRSSFSFVSRASSASTSSRN